MARNYLRPESLNKLCEEIKGYEGKIIPLFGILNRSELNMDQILLLDLQDSGLDQVEYASGEARIGSCIFLEDLLELFPDNPTWSEMIKREYNQNQRNQIRLGGVIRYKNGRSGLLTTLLALDADLEFFYPSGIKASLGDYLVFRNQYQNHVLLRVSIPYERIIFRFEAIRRTPVDLPIVCVALARWRSGRIRVCLGGYGDSPIMVYDARGFDGIQNAVKDAFSDATDFWASSEYRSNMAVLLTDRILESVLNEEKYVE